MPERWHPRLLTEEELLRFMSKITIVRHNRWLCWEWQGKRDRYGYGRFWMDGQWRSAHRIAYVCLRVFVTLPSGKSRRRMIPAQLPDADHRCVNSSCVRPSHLKAVTNAENQKLRGERAREYRARRYV